MPDTTPIPEAFVHCPRCAAPRRAAVAGATGDAGRREDRFECERCGFLFYFNAAPAVAAIVSDADDRIVCIRRAQPPGEGRLGWPGGFVDRGESAEEAVRRETREEIGVELGDLRYLCSAANTYPFGGLLYHTVDLFFVATARDPGRSAALDAVDAVCWLRASEIDPSQLAFDSFREAWTRYLQQAHQAPGSSGPAGGTRAR